MIAWFKRLFQRKEEEKKDLFETLLEYEVSKVEHRRCNRKEWPVVSGSWRGLDDNRLPPPGTRLKF